MNIGFDITSLYVAQAGVFYYRYNQIKAMLALNMPEHRFLLLDYFPVHGGWRNPPEVATLIAPNAELRHVHGVRQRKLSRLNMVHRLGLRPFAKTIDETLFAPWGQWEKRVKARQLQANLAGLDIFHTSDVLQYAVPGVKIVTTIYDMTTLLFPEMHMAETREMQQQKYRFAQDKANAVIAISESAKQDVIELLGIEPERVYVVYAGVDPSFRPLPAAEVAQVIAPLGLEPDGYILHVGTIEPRKNLVRLINAYHMLRQETTPPVPPLVLAGASGWMCQEVFDRVDNLGLKDVVLFPGKIAAESLPALYNGARLFVYPSLYEGFGMPPLEAMACGTPVIVSNASSLPEIVGQAGVYVKPEDTQSIIDGLLYLLQDTSVRQEIANKGIERAKEFSWRKAAEETIAIYATIN